MVCLEPGPDEEVVLSYVQKCLNAMFGIEETTIQVEDWMSESMGCRDYCNVDLE